MSKTHIERAISVLNRGTKSVDSQITISHWLFSNGYNPSSGGIKQSAIQDNLSNSLDYTAETSLSHLENINLVEKYMKHDITYVIAEWHPDVFVMGQVNEVATNAIERLIDDLEPPESQGDQVKIVTDGSGKSLREVIADKFDLHTTMVESHLRDDDPVDRLNQAVQAIEKSDEYETGDDYGKIVFRNSAYRYQITEAAKKLYKL